jgi:uncharacterized membrane protein
MKRFDAILALTLRIGILASAFLFLFGLIFSFSFLMSLGMYVLLATPVIRVVLSIIFFALQKNKLYVTITSIVLFNLLVAIFALPFFRLI